MWLLVVMVVMVVTRGLSHTPSSAVRHLPLNSARIGLRYRRGTLYLRAAVHRRCQRPTEGLVLTTLSAPYRRFGTNGTNDAVSALSKVDTNKAVEAA